MNQAQQPVDGTDELDDEEFAAEAVEPIAIIAINGRFPGAKTTEQFWENLKNGVESIKFFTMEELSGEHIDEALLHNPKFVRADGVLDDIDLFDAEFFNYSPREAEIMDPQHRMFLECAWETMELAGYDPAQYDGRVGVFAGAGLSSYLIRNLLKNSEFVDTVGSFQTMLANDKDFLATKVSYKMNLMGPSVNTNTLCSSSMVGVHFACQSLWNYQTDLNLAGGVSLQVSRNEAFFYQEGGIGAGDGHCRAFDANARGTVSGSGLGVVALKRLSDAIADGDPIHAVIRGSAVNNDGGVKMSYTAPSIEGQAEVIAEAQSVGDIDPETITYVECHGTGTVLGDPVEIAGLTKAFRLGSEKNQYCAVGSVKTNIGHLVSAGGVASLIKTVLALKNRQIPPSLNFDAPNPKIDFANSPFFVNDRLRDWAAPDGGPLRAGVSSFGIGGTNVHCVVEEAPAPEPGPPSHRDWQTLTISARAPEALGQATRNLADHLDRHPELDLADVAYTLHVGRKTFPYRRALACSDRGQAVAALREAAEAGSGVQFQEAEARPTVFMFSGQGSQYPNMGRELRETEPVFRHWLDACCDKLTPHLGLDLRDILYPPAGEEEAAAAKLNRTELAQPALFAVEYAVAQLWMSWGVAPQAMIGHSVGEYVAACLAGVFSLDDALSLVADRGRMIGELPEGDMLAVPLGEDELKPWLEQHPVSLAAVNAPRRCVVSGDAEAIAALSQALAERKIACSALHTSHAFHSHMMDPILEPFKQRVAAVERKPPEIPYLSNVTGAWITPEQATDPDYWTRHLRGAVRFSDGVAELYKEESRVLLEVGPGRALATLARQHPDRPDRAAVFHAIRHPRDKQSDAQFLAGAVGSLWTAGVQLDWRGFHAEERRRREPLPTYPFARRRFWIEPDMDQFGTRNPRRGAAPAARKDPADWFSTPVWAQTPPATPPADLPRKQRWLLFADGHGLAAALAKRLQDEGQETVTVALGDRFNKLDNDIYTVKPGSLEDFNALVDELAKREQLPRFAVNLWPVDAAPEDAPSAQRANRALDRGFYSPVYLVQALNRKQITDPLQLIAVTAGLFDGGEPENATALGALRALPLEFPHIACRAVDVAREPARSWRERRLVEALYAELAGAQTEPTVALDGRGRWVQGFEPLRLDAPAASPFRKGGVYLLLGGLGGVGLALAEAIAAAGSVHLVFAEPRNFPDASLWDGWTARHGEDDETGQTIRQLQALRQAGATLTIREVDLTDPAALESLVEETERATGPIRGVVHTAGVFGREVFRAVAETSQTACAPLFHAKLAGLPALDEALGDRELDFCIVLSSLSALLGGLGLAAYAGANAFVDAFTRRRNRLRPAPWTALNWDGWLDGGEGPGAGAAFMGAMALDRQEGVEAARRLIARGGIEQAALTKEDLGDRLHWLLQRQSGEDADTAKNYDIHPRPNLQNPYVAPRNEIEEKVAAIWRKRLGIEEVGVFDNFFELGGDSLQVVRVRQGLQEAFDADFLTADLFEHPTVSALAEYIAKEREGPSFDRVNTRAERQRQAMEAEEEAAARARRRRRSFD